MYVVVCYQAAVIFEGRTRWIWVVVVEGFIAGSLMATRDPLLGLGMALTNMAYALVISGIAIVTQQMDAARTSSRRAVEDLEASHRQLEDYAAQADDLAVLEERNRLARELHDSVSQAMFGILLATRSAQMLREKQPEDREAVAAQIETLQTLTQDALARMRGFIGELRPKS
jgi:signal transduction histidine kinase